MEKKQQQLGMNPSTASGRLVKDILYKLVSERDNNCYRCGKGMTRETFSVEHKEAWLDSADPVGLFFSLDNISFSHHSCNVAAGRRKYETQEESLAAKRAAKARSNAKREYSSDERKARYLRVGS